MNIALHRWAGTNSDEAEYRASAEVLPPNMTRWRLGACWGAYERSGDGLFSRQEFEALTRAAHIVHVVILGPDQGGQGATFAIMGLELMRDRNGPYTQFLYFEQQRGRLVDIAGMVVWITFSVAKAYHKAESDALFGRCLLKGRKGWPRVLRRLGIKIDAEGWISENQEYFGYGIERRQSVQ